MAGRRSMQRGSTLVAAAALAAVLSGCSARGGNIAYNPTHFTAPDADPIPPVTADRRLGAGDTITIRVFKVDSLSGDQTIDSAGRINLPLAGYVTAAGETTGELEQQLTRLLGAKYLADPKIAVTLKTAVPRTVTVDGSVEQPGIYPMQANTTLIKTIAMAHGTAEGANPKRVVVFRRINGQRTAAAFDLTTIRNGIDPDPVIYANDIVIVDGRQTNPAWTTLLQTVPLLGLFTRF